MGRRLLRFFFVCILVMGLSSAVSAQYVVDLNVPLYGQEEDDWSGPASVQMSMDGYPDPGNNFFLDQPTIWYIIQINNLVGEPTTWVSDPNGVREALMTLNPPPAGTWSLMTDTVREDLMFQILYWMNVQEYPTPTLVYEGARWVVIKGYETDIEPVSGSSPVLEMITIHDPFPTGQGATSTMTGTVWYDNLWNGPVNAPGTWFGEYVAIIEPPQIQGVVGADSLIRSGDPSGLISPQQALAYSQQWMTLLNLSAKDPSYSVLSESGLVALDPILVYEEVKPTVNNKSICYYLLPYARGSEYKKGLVSASVIVNAFTGEFEEVSSFGNPITYLSRERAIDSAAKVIKLSAEDMKGATAKVVFSPCDLSYIRAYPFWRVQVKSRVAYVEMNGTPHASLPTSSGEFGK